MIVFDDHVLYGISETLAGNQMTVYRKQKYFKNRFLKRKSKHCVKFIHLFEKSCLKMGHTFEISLA